MVTDKNQNSSSYTRMISIYLWICIAGLIISIPIFNNMISKHDLEISNDICGLIAEKMNNSITYITESVSGRAEIISSDTIDDWDKIYGNMLLNLDAEGCNSIGLINKSGHVFGEPSEAKDFEKWELNSFARGMDRVFFSPPYRQSKSGKMVFTIFTPIYQDNRRAGELYMTYYLDEIEKMAKSEILAENMEIYLMNPYSNNYISCYGADSTQIGSWNNSRLLYGQLETTKGKSYDDWLQSMINGENGEVLIFELNDKLYTQVFVNIDAMKDWSVVVRVPNDALSHNLRIFHMTVIFVIVILIISLFALFVLSNRRADSEKRALEYLSVHDPLTSLQNRRAFEKAYNNYLAGRTEASPNGALVFFDIDYFKQVNDGFGHAMGDRVLVDFANISSEIFVKNGIMSRFGGDEFVLLIKNLENKEIIEEQMVEFHDRLNALDYLKKEDGSVFRIHYSAGIVEVTGKNNSLEESEKKADKALYNVKKRGRNGYEWFD